MIRKDVLAEKVLEVISVDTGWSLTKTPNDVFVTGIKEITSIPAIYSAVLEYEGKYYKIGTNRLEVTDTKTDDENCFLLILVAVAKELKRRGKNEANVFLALGLPLTRFGAEKKKLIDYVSREGMIEFSYEQECYKIEIKGVAVFPQCYAAVADKIPYFTKKTIIVDIGSWTIDIMPVVNKAPDESNCITIPKGLITCMRSINEQCVRKLNGEIEESDIQYFMRFGKVDLDESYIEIMKSEIEKFAERVYNSLREYGYNLNTIPIIFVGGGAAVMKNFGQYNQKNINYILDVKANAKGYEQLAKLGLKHKK